MSMMMMMVVVIGVSLMVGSDALKCYKCEHAYWGVNITTKPIYIPGQKCFDPTLLADNETCEAKQYCAVHWRVFCPYSTYDSLIHF